MRKKQLEQGYYVGCIKYEILTQNSCQRLLSQRKLQYNILLKNYTNDDDDNGGHNDMNDGAWGLPGSGGGQLAMQM